MKRIVSATALLVIAAACVAMNATATHSKAGANGKSLTFKLVEKDVAFNYIDNPPKGGPNEPPLIGDQFAFTGDLLTTAGKHAGILDAICSVTRGGTRARVVCSGFFSLKGGQLALTALLKFAQNSSAPDHIVIVGGTGVYEGVTGNILSKSRGEDSPFSDDTLHLIWP